MADRWDIQIINELEQEATENLFAIHSTESKLMILAALLGYMHKMIYIYRYTGTYTTRTQDDSFSFF